MYIRTYLDVCSTKSYIYVLAVYFINRKGHEKIAELLIQHEKTDVSAKNKYGDTPIHLTIS